MLVFESFRTTFLVEIRFRYSTKWHFSNFPSTEKKATQERSLYTLSSWWFPFQLLPNDFVRIVSEMQNVPAIKHRHYCVEIDQLLACYAYLFLEGKCCLQIGKTQKGFKLPIFVIIFNISRILSFNIFATFSQTILRGLAHFFPSDLIQITWISK